MPMYGSLTEAMEMTDRNVFTKTVGTSAAKDSFILRSFENSESPDRLTISGGR
jgi:hypothetical protein